MIGSPKRVAVLMVVLSVMVWPWPVQAEEKMSADEIAKELSNPTTLLASLNTSLSYSRQEVQTYLRKALR